MARKAESRRLVFFSRGDVFAGLVLRGRGVDKVLVRKCDESLLASLLEESVMKEVREVAKAPGSSTAKSLEEALSPPEGGEEYAEFLESIVEELLALAGSGARRSAKP